jgi:hypothetical protein
MALHTRCGPGARNERRVELFPARIMTHVTLLAEVDLVTRIAGSRVRARRVWVNRLPPLRGQVRRRLDRVTGVAELQPEVVTLEAVLGADAEGLGPVCLQPVAALMEGRPRKNTSPMTSLALTRCDDLRKVGRLMPKRVPARMARRAVNFVVSGRHRRSGTLARELRMALLAEPHIDPSGHRDISPRRQVNPLVAVVTRKPGEQLALEVNAMKNDG